MRMLVTCLMGSLLGWLVGCSAGRPEESRPEEESEFIDVATWKGEGPTWREAVVDDLPSGLSAQYPDAVRYRQGKVGTLTVFEITRKNGSESEPDKFHFYYEGETRVRSDGFAKDKLVDQRQYIGGKLELVKTWYPSGQLKSQTTYDAGELDGPYKVWHENGQLKIDGYHGGEGEDSTKTEYDKNKSEIDF